MIIILLKELEKEREGKQREKDEKEQEKRNRLEEKQRELELNKMKQREKELEKERQKMEKELEKGRLEYEKLREREEKELEREKNRDKERERLDREFEKKKERDNEKWEGHLRAKEELDREKERREKMKLKEREEKQRQREREKEEKERQKEKEKDERNRREERNKRERQEKERQKQLEKMEKYRLKEERERQKQIEREEREKEKKREKEEREREKQRLREERKRYNERFQNASIKLIRGNNRRTDGNQRYDNFGKIWPQGGYYQRQSYNSNKLYHRKRRLSHKRIQPRNRIPRLEPKKNLGKTSVKIIKPKRYDDDETETEPADFEEKLMKFPKFRAKYGKNYILKNSNKIDNLNTYLTDFSGRLGGTKKTNLTISEVDEEEEKNNKLKGLVKGKLKQVRPKGKFMNLDSKMREILGKHYKLLVDDPLNPYSTFWPSNFLRAGYGAGFEYEEFQAGVPVLKLRNLGKKQLPPIKKKGFQFTENTHYSANRNTGHNIYPGSPTNIHFNQELHDIKTNKSDSYQFKKFKFNDLDEHQNLKDIKEENEN